MNRSYASYYMAGLVALATFALYLPALQNGFVLWDDDIYVTSRLQILSLDVSFFTWAFSTFAAGFWHPLTWISLALDHAVWGMDPMGFHLTNILLHAMNTVLVVLLMIRLVDWGTASRREPSFSGGRAGTQALIAGGIAGLLFGIHPLHVESVAWISERKDLLCALFYLASILSYLHYVREPVRAYYRDRRYLLSFALFVCALSSKTMAISLPVVLLALDWYPLKRFGQAKNLRTVLLEKIPFMAFSLLFAVLSILAQKSFGALATTGAAPFPLRMLLAFKALSMYLVKMVVPFDLLPLYPYPKVISLFSIDYLASLALAAGITGLCIVLAKKQPWWLGIWAYFLVTLLPVIGIVPFGSSFMADRFTYLPSVGPFLAAGLVAAWGWSKLARPMRYAGTVKVIVAAAALALLLSLCIKTVKQIAVWNNSITLWSFVIAKEYAASPLVYNNRGLAYKEEGRFDNAIRDFTFALQLDPNDSDALNYRGVAYSESGRYDAALRDFDRAIEVNPSWYETYNNRGIAHEELGMIDKAIADYSTAIRLDRSEQVFATYNNRAIAYYRAGRFSQALEDCTTAIRLNPLHAGAYNSRALVYEATGDFTRALEDYDRAISLNPLYEKAHENRAILLKKGGR